MRYFILISLNILFFSMYAQEVLVSCGDSLLSYEGRISQLADSRVLAWSGSSVSIKTNASTVRAELCGTDTADYFNVIVDGIVSKQIHVSNKKHIYSIAENLSSGIHVIQLFKRTCWDKGQTHFYNFRISPTAQIYAIEKKRRSIEFYGNSISCGYAVDDSSGSDSGTGRFENNYVAYPAITARYFDAQYRCIAKGGIGLLISWFPLTMPQMYNRLNPLDSSLIYDFKDFNPAIVVVNLGQNDYWLLNKPKHPEYISRFSKKAPTSEDIIYAYCNFIRSLRAKYPEAYIICSLGNMDATDSKSPWPTYIRTSVARLNDNKILTHFFEYKNSLAHPNRADQQKIADSLISFINETIVW